MPQRLLLVDDTATFLAAASALLTAEGFDVVGEAGDGLTALELATLLRPDLVVVDIGLPDIDGFLVSERLTQQRGAAPAVVLVSSRDWSDLAQRVAAAGAAGFLHKDDLDGAALRSLLGRP